MQHWPCNEVIEHVRSAHWPLRCTQWSVACASSPAEHYQAAPEVQNPKGKRKSGREKNQKKSYRRLVDLSSNHCLCRWTMCIEGDYVTFSVLLCKGCIIPGKSERIVTLSKGELWPLLCGATIANGRQRAFSHQSFLMVAIIPARSQQ